MRIISTWWLQSDSPVCSPSRSQGTFPAPKKANPNGSYLLSPTSAWSPRGMADYGTSAGLRRTTAGLRLVRAVEADKRDHGSCRVAPGRLRGAVRVSFITAGFADAISTAVSISKGNTEHCYNHLVLLVWFGCVYADSLQIAWYQPEIAS